MPHLPAAIRLLSLWRDPPDWIVWARPTTEIEYARLGPGVDLVLTIDVGEDEEARRDYGVCDVGVGVRWYDERRATDVATFILMRDAEGVTPWMAWLRDARRDLRRRATRDGYTREQGIVVLRARPR